MDFVLLKFLTEQNLGYGKPSTAFIDKQPVKTWSYIFVNEKIITFKAK